MNRFLFSFLPPARQWEIRYLTVFLLLGSVLWTGCIPYTVGTTAQPVPEGELAPISSFSYVPAGASVEENAGDEATTGYALPSVGARYGLDQASELGLRAPGLTGIVLDYKRRVAGDSTRRTPALALMGGAGIVNFGWHAHLEASVLLSGPERGRDLVPYGGLRAMQVIPLNDRAVNDYPTLGGFIGLRIGTTELGVSPEVGVFYDPPALELRSHDVIVVPALTLHGHGLLEVFDD